MPKVAFSDIVITGESLFMLFKVNFYYKKSSISF